MDWYFLVYLAFTVIGGVLTYLGIRTIDYLYHKRDRKYDHLNDVELSDIRYQHAKGCIQSFTNGQKSMAKDMVKAINDSVFQMAKQFEDL